MGQAKQNRLRALQAVEIGGAVKISEASRQRLSTLKSELDGADMVVRAGVAALEQLRAHFNRELDSLMTALGVPRGAQWTLDLEVGALIPAPSGASEAGASESRDG